MKADCPENRCLPASLRNLSLGEGEGRIAGDVSHEGHGCTVLAPLVEEVPVAVREDSAAEDAATRRPPFRLRQGQRGPGGGRGRPEGLERQEQLHGWPQRHERGRVFPERLVDQRAQLVAAELERRRPQVRGDLREAGLAAARADGLVEDLHDEVGHHRPGEAPADRVHGRELPHGVLELIRRRGGPLGPVELPEAGRSGSLRRACCPPDPARTMGRHVCHGGPRPADRPRPRLDELALPALDVAEVAAVNEVYVHALDYAEDRREQGLQTSQSYNPPVELREVPLVLRHILL
mmetsp:Transcript_51560/g.145336  ORF Transcript_51560/g.145336 Transcript_51560/m.145336 type:complete len:293 (-) Transcript_51560:1028-1906(-)